MPSLAQMWETCRRLSVELSRESLDRHRLLEIETIIRLLVPHLTRAIAEAVHRRGMLDQLRDAGTSLLALRESLTWVDERRDVPLPEIQDRVRRAVLEATQVLDILERL